MEACSHPMVAKRIKENAVADVSYNIGEAWDSETCPAVMEVKREMNEVP